MEDATSQPPRYTISQKSSWKGFTPVRRCLRCHALREPGTVNGILCGACHESHPDWVEEHGQLTRVKHNRIQFEESAALDRCRACKKQVFAEGGTTNDCINTECDNFWHLKTLERQLDGLKLCLPKSRWRPPPDPVQLELSPH